MKTIGIVDYGVGNHASVAHTLRRLGYRVKVSPDPMILNSTDALVLPGVGAFPCAMEGLHVWDLVPYIRERALTGRPLLGICLGMQLLTTSSDEHCYTQGLDLIPGEVNRMEDARSHIGWNCLDCIDEDPLFKRSHGRYFYFNHSYVYHGPPKYRVAVAFNPQPLTAAIRRDNVIGLQFHPEKSHIAGQMLLRTVIEGLLDA
jgi:glutamine amidotransferase